MEIISEDNICDVCLKRIDNETCLADLLTLVLNSLNPLVSQTEENSTNISKIQNRENKICSICFGLFDAEFCRKVTNSIEEKLSAEQYDVDDFNVCVSYPIACLVRDRLAEIRLEKSTNFVALKDLSKMCYKASLENALKMRWNSASDFNICINLNHVADQGESSKMSSVFSEVKGYKNAEKRRKRKRQKVQQDNQKVSRGDLLVILPALNNALVEKFDLKIPSTPADQFCNYEIVLERQPLFFGGRYIKYSRYVNQTPWMVDGEIRSKNSVQELLAVSILDKIRCDEIKFSASGREDADVRMLGDGRPFVLQFINPRRAKFTQRDMNVFERSINSSTVDIRATHLRLVCAADFELLKQGEEHKLKHYAALCYTPCVVTPAGVIDRIRELTHLELIQKTPIRVLHRRPLHDRRREIKNLNALYVDEHHFQLFLITQAGTYVKEFVHGDFGRTRPSLTSILGIPIDILELDVEKVDLVWPPSPPV